MRFMSFSLEESLRTFLKPSAVRLTSGFRENNLKLYQFEIVVQSQFQKLYLLHHQEAFHLALYRNLLLKVGLKHHHNLVLDKNSHEGRLIFLGNCLRGQSMFRNYKSGLTKVMNTYWNKFTLFTLDFT